MKEPKDKKTKDTDNRKKSDKLQKGILYTAEYELYCRWKALPPMLKTSSPEELAKFLFDDDVILMLCEIKTQTQFAEKYGIDQDTLTSWNKKIKERDIFADIREWLKPITKNVVMSAYRSAMSKDPKANADRKLALQLVGWTEESNVNLKGEGLFDILKRELDDERKNKQS